MKIGILAYQGGVDEHRYMVLEACKELSFRCEVENIVKPSQLNEIDGLIIPGGESTTIVKFAHRFGIIEPLRAKILQGLPVLGTCAGAVILAKRVEDFKTKKVLPNVLGVLDATVLRNYYGRQRESFEVDIDIPVLGDKPFRAVFIRAPAIIEIGPEVKPLAVYGENYVFVQERNILATVFHPELTNDTRVHKYFLKLVKT